MKQHIRAALMAVMVSTLAMSLGGCGLFHKKRVAVASRPAPRPAVAPPQVVPPARGEPSEIVWNLRAGLNVAALSCRGQGRQAVADDYARLLARHRAVLASAYRQEQARQGTMAAFDRQQTRIYNGFANQSSPAQFCRAAEGIAQRANGLQSAAFVTAAPRLLGELRASLR